jgi:hypothetical protein
VPQRVGQALLGDAEGREVHPRGQQSCFALHLQADVDVAGARLPDEPVQLGQSRLRGQGRGLPVGTEHPEQSPHLGECLACRRLDRGEIGGLLGMRGTEPAAYGLGLDGHHADRVGHDVVQLAGDPGPLGRGGQRGPQHALALQLLGSGDRLLDATRPLPESGAHRPRADDEDHRCGQVARDEPTHHHPAEERDEHHSQAEVVTRRDRLGPDGERDEHEAQQCGELVVGVDEEVGADHQQATASGYCRRHASVAMAPPATGCAPAATGQSLQPTPRRRSAGRTEPR